MCRKSCDRGPYGINYTIDLQTRPLQWVATVFGYLLDLIPSLYPNSALSLSQIVEPAVKLRLLA